MGVGKHNSLSSQGLASCTITLALSLQHHLEEGEWRQVGRLAGLPIVHHPGYVCPLPPNHRFKMMKFHYLYEILLGDGVIKKDKQASRCTWAHKHVRNLEYYSGQV